MTGRGVKGGHVWSRDLKVSVLTDGLDNFLKIRATLSGPRGSGVGGMVPVTRRRETIEVGGGQRWRRRLQEKNVLIKER